ncbi:protein MEI2-like 5 isoform X2 [Chenopodium quinoa]|uniref:protein MEI2-like 5 isoform X2 n=1 Tax=Chenopodium quinoa TaxID=63459 RepID=UPI000B7751BA|nr:protein MEI2-like 5 isoform X2 [Chenopodium quinoa]
MGQRAEDSVLGSWNIPLTGKPKEMGTGPWNMRRSPMYHTSSDASLFSSSLPVLPHEKLSINDSANGRQVVDDGAANLDKVEQDVEGVDSLDDDIVNHTIDFVLPGEDALFADLANDYDFTGLASQVDDMEEGDFFGNLGGMELENDVQDTLSLDMSKFSLSDGITGNGMIQYGPPNAGAIAGEHPYGEHPSRTLFVRNINSNVEDSELRNLFEQYGDIRTLYTACKHRGFVMISYYDIRDARSAMRALQNKPLRRRKLDIHFSIPKDNPSEKDINQGTLVVFNLDPSVSNEELRLIFGAYGEVKEIRETPHKKHHKFIEFYDVRAAEAALRALNRSDIAGKRIKLEPSRPGGTRRNLMLQLNQELDHEESRFRHHVGSPITNSPPGSWLQQLSSPVNHNAVHAFSRSPGYRTMSPTTNNHLPGLASILHSQASGSPKLAPIGKDFGRGSHVEQMFANSSEQRANLHTPHSFPELKLGSQLSGSMSSFGASTSNGSAIETLSGPQFLWGSPTTFSENAKSTAWSAHSGNPLLSNGHRHGYPYSSRHGPYLSSVQHNQQHVGSAPSGIHHLERHFGFFPESPETSYVNPGGFGGINRVPSNGNYMMSVGPRSAMHAGIAGNMSESNSPSFRMMSSPRLSPVFLGNGPYTGQAVGIESERTRTRRVESNTNQVDCKKQFQLDLEKIANGEDGRTTLMIKNIPNKYTSKMLLAAIDENHKGTYDFIYLPIDFKNKCNVGYAFINMLSPLHIIPFYKAFNGKKWEKFNSEKVASLAYARIQGRTALIAHFQNSSLMNEDKRCRPILFHSEGDEAGEQIIQEHLPSTSFNIQMRQPNGSESGEFSGNNGNDDVEEKSDELL